MTVCKDGPLCNNGTLNTDGGLRTSIYLDTNVNYVSGDGTSNNLFVIE